jgi:hypothetical protein
MMALLPIGWSHMHGWEDGQGAKKDLPEGRSEEFRFPKPLVLALRLILSRV